MGKTKKEHFAGVISANPYNNSYVSNVSNILSAVKSPIYDKNQFTISYLNTQGYINSHIEISKNIPDEDLFDAISIKIYDELALDQAIEYQIQYIEVFNFKDTDNRHFQIFIADPSTVQTTYKNIVDKLQFLDVIIPTPLLIKSLYAKDILQENGVDCFIYFEEHDSFITFYSDAEFVYTKSLKFSFPQLHERFCELCGEKVEYTDFFKILSGDSLKDADNNYKSFVFKLYKEIFANISDIFTYVKRAVELEKIDHIYIGSQGSSITALDEIAEVELGIKTSNFAFNYGFEGSESKVEDIHALMQLYTSVEKSRRYECNFSTFHRPPSFTQRESGKILLLTAASFIIAFAYPVFNWTLTYLQELNYASLEVEYNKVHKERVERETTIRLKEEDKKKVLALLEQEKTEYTEKKNTLIKIHDVKVNYPMKAKLLHLLTQDLNEYEVNVDSLKYDEEDTKKKFTFNLVSTKDKTITKLIEHLTLKYDKKFNFSLEKIFFDEKEAKYFGELKVTIL